MAGVRSAARSKLGVPQRKKRATIELPDDIPLGVVRNPLGPTIPLDEAAPPPGARARSKQPEGATLPLQGVDPHTAVQLAVMRILNRKEDDGSGLKAAIEECLPRPHAKQTEIMLSPAKRKVVNVGRRGGKTTLGAIVAILKALEGRRVLLASTTQEQADAFWEKCLTWLSDFIAAGDIIKNEQKRLLLFPAFGGRIKVKTARDADTLRGDYADFLVLDECAILDPDAWYKVGAPMLMDNDGECWFLSTPRRRNWFFALYVEAEEDTEGRWAVFHFTSHDNPHLSKEALAEIVKELDEDSYRQEILAEFLEGEGAVFKNIDRCMVGEYAAPPTTPAEHAGHLKVGGVDWGQTNDYTVISILCVTCHREVHFERFNRNKWRYQRLRIKDVYYTWLPYAIYVEQNSVGSVNIEALRDGEAQENGMWEAGIPGVEAFDTNKVTKPQLVNRQKLDLEREVWHYLESRAATAEYQAYEAIVSARTGNISYSAPKGVHDDCVMSRMIAGWAAQNAMPAEGPGTQSYSQMPGVAQYGSLEEAVAGVSAVYSGYGEMMTGTDLASDTFGASPGYNHAMPAPPGRPW